MPLLHIPRGGGVFSGGEGLLQRVADGVHARARSRGGVSRGIVHRSPRVSVEVGAIAAHARANLDGERRGGVGDILGETTGRSAVERRDESFGRETVRGGVARRSRERVDVRLQRRRRRRVQRCRVVVTKTKRGRRRARRVARRQEHGGIARRAAETNQRRR